jgi:hypothetical protein
MTLLVSLSQAVAQGIPRSAEIPRGVVEEFWKRPDFWIATLISSAGLVFSILAFLEAAKAKRAATEAGRTVKLQTVTIELTEVAHRFERIQPGIRFSDARELLNDVSRRVRRAVSPFADDVLLAGPIKALLDALSAAESSLKLVRPADSTKEDAVPDAVYYGIEGDFTTINNLAGC